MSGTNPEHEERYRSTYHWDSAPEIQIIVAGTPGAQNLGAAIGVGTIRRIREITARFSGTDDIVVYLVEATGFVIRLSFNLSSGSTRVWSSQDGRTFTAGEQAMIYADSVTGGTLFVTGAGLEFLP